jgi:hypothetical protein
VQNKIIYISGGEKLDRAAIKIAFDEVRQVLGLGADVLLFGVPLEDKVADCNAQKEESGDDATPPVSKPKQARKPKAPEVATEPEPVPERVIPILSVLSGGKANNQESEPVPEQPIEWDAALDEDLPTPAPKTIEEIFENLTPLAEEKIIECPRDDSDDARIQDIDNDATLSKLAAEFVETQSDPIAEPVKQSRTSRLKNILPFKKAKKDETSVLGDLFGWAGIAANDDDAVVPGFFAAR